MEVLNYILGGFTLASTLGALAATFYGVRSKTIITTLRESNDAYKERNVLLEADKLDLQRKYDETLAQHAAEISDLRGRLIVLEKIKTPPLEPMMKMIATNHSEVMKALGKKPTRKATK